MVWQAEGGVKCPAHQYECMVRVHYIAGSLVTTGTAVQAKSTHGQPDKRLNWLPRAPTLHEHWGADIVDVLAVLSPIPSLRLRACPRRRRDPRDHDETMRGHARLVEASLCAHCSCAGVEGLVNTSARRTATQRMPLGVPLWPPGRRAPVAPGCLPPRSSVQAHWSHPACSVPTRRHHCQRTTRRRIPSIPCFKACA